MRVGSLASFQPLSLAVHVFGLLPTVLPLPMSQFSNLLVDPVAVALLFPNNGTVQAPLTIPNNSSLVGTTFRNQVLGIELDAAINILRVTATSSYQMTLGGF